MARKTSTDYMREMRARLTAAGYVKRELYVLPENAEVLRNVEKVLRQPYLGNRIKLEGFMTENTKWTIDTLHSALIELDVVKNNEIELTLVQGAEPSLSLAMHTSVACPSSSRLPVTRFWLIRCWFMPRKSKTRRPSTIPCCAAGISSRCPRSGSKPCPTARSSTTCSAHSVLRPR